MSTSDLLFTACLVLIFLAVMIDLIFKKAWVAQIFTGVGFVFYMPNAFIHEPSWPAVWGA